MRFISCNIKENGFSVDSTDTLTEILIEYTFVKDDESETESISLNDTSSFSFDKYTGEFTVIEE